MNKKVLIILLVVLGLIACIYIFVSTGLLKFETVGENEETPISVFSVEDLEDGCYYIWHNDKESDIKADLEGITKDDVFKLCPSGDINWDKNSYVNHTIWFTSGKDDDIPTFYPGDELLYISSTYVPYEGISWERFADYGYTIGVANMEGDNSGHYRIVNSGSGYSGYIYPFSDASVLEQYVNVTDLFLDKIGSVKVRDNFISDGGTVYGLEKDQTYLCEWYTGTYYQDYEMKANIHAFCSLESFTTYDYEFLHSNCIAITIPDWIKTGYYYLDGLGLFRYLSSADAQIYNEKAYDPQIDWNDPIFIYDENGFLQYDPTMEDDINTVEINPDLLEIDRESGTDAKSGIVMEDNAYKNTNYNIWDDSDGGAEDYEYIYNEIIVP